MLGLILLTVAMLLVVVGPLAILVIGAWLAQRTQDPTIAARSVMFRDGKGRD